MTVRHVCFDWGGVILKHCRSWAEGCAAAGLDVRIDLDCQTGLARRRELTRMHQVGKVQHDEYLLMLREATGSAYSTDELARLHDAWLLGEYEGVDRVIARLAATTSVETGLLSNTNHSHWLTHMSHAGSPAKYPTAGLLAHRHASHLMGMMKPDADIYREFERRVGASGQDILFFDDLADNIKTAASLSWRTVHVDHTGDTAAQITAALRAHGVW